MALKAEVKKKIADLLKIKEADFDAALKDANEVDLEIPGNLQVLTEEELTTRDANMKKEGEKAGREIGMKEVKKAAGLPEDAPARDPGKLAQAIAEKATADAGIKVDEKVRQLDDQVKLLQREVQDKEQAIVQEKQRASAVEIDRDILAAFPKERASTLTDQEYLTLIKANYTFERAADGSIQAKKDGELVREKGTQNPRKVSDVVGDIFTERTGWKAEDKGGGVPPGGRGGSGAPPTGGYTKLSEIRERFKAEGKNELGEEFQNEVSKAAAANKDFKFDA
jgi:hypothetical protein